MPGAEWFPGARLSYVENLFRQADPARPALVVAAEREAPRAVSWAELEREVAAAAAALAALGVAPGDRVAGYLPNRLEAVVSFLAAASLGAVWTCAPPEFGARSVIDRFRQVEPKVLIGVDGVVYGGKATSTAAPSSRPSAPRCPGWRPRWWCRRAPRRRRRERSPGAIFSRAAGGARLAPLRLPFDHPLWILYSSGTTGPPKAIVHSAGGILLEHLKSNALQLDLGPGDLFFWYTTTGWMMWNKLVSGLAVGATVMLYDGSAGHPDLTALWRLAAESGVTYLGVSAAFLAACRRDGVEPKRFDLSRLRTLGSTGSPLSPAGFAWVYEAVASDLWLQSGSGGTDVCTAFLGGVPGAPVRAGELQGRALGAAVEAWDASGRPVVGRGRRAGGHRSRCRRCRSASGTIPTARATARATSSPGPASGATATGSASRRRGRRDLRPLGRDAQPPRRAARVERDLRGGRGAARGRSRRWWSTSSCRSARPGWGCSSRSRPARRSTRRSTARIRAALRRELSPRHVPDAIVAVAAIPKTLNGKKLEVPVKKVLAGAAPERVATADALADPAALVAFAAIGERLRRGEL